MQASRVLSISVMDDAGTTRRSRMTLEAMISIGLFGWMVVGMVLMGLGIW